MTASHDKPQVFKSPEQATDFFDKAKNLEIGLLLGLIGVECAYSNRFMLVCGHFHR
jgi:hypothetical protein